MSWIEMNAKYPGRCCLCRKSVLQGARIFWNTDGSHRIRHSTHNDEFRRHVGGSGYSDPSGFDSGITIVGGSGGQPTRSLNDLSNDSDFRQRKQARENLRECYN